MQLMAVMAPAGTSPCLPSLLPPLSHTHQVSTQAPPYICGVQVISAETQDAVHQHWVADTVQRSLRDTRISLHEVLPSIVLLYSLFVYRVAADPKSICKQ